jgi:hypothetical protein
MVKFRGTTFIAKCHAKGQKLKLDKMKVWKIVNLFNFERKQPMRFKTFNCWEALRHIILRLLAVVHILT